MLPLLVDGQTYLGVYGLKFDYGDSVSWLAQQKYKIHKYLALFQEFDEKINNIITLLARKHIMCIGENVKIQPINGKPTNRYPSIHTCINHDN